MSKNLDELLYRTLHADAQETAPALNRQILEQAEKLLSESEVSPMKKLSAKKEFLSTKKQAARRIPKTAAAAIAVCILLAGGGTAYAAHRYLSASEISDRVSDNKRLAQAFESKDAIFINETQASGDYVFTLLGLVSGSDLEPYVPEETADNLSKQRTYAAVAIAKANSSAMPKNSSASPLIGDVSFQSASNGTADTSLSQTENSDMPEHSFCVSPLIGGVSFQTANNGTMNTSLHWFIQDHVTYELMACDDLEIFADRGVWLSIVPSFGQEMHAFSMDTASGTYTKNESYDDFSALFRLPLDETKADTAAADAYLKALEADGKSDSASAAADDSDTPAWIAEFIADLTEDNINTRCTLQPEYTLIATPDADGWIDFGSVYIASEDMTYDGSAGQIAYLINDDQDFIVTGYSYSDSPETDLTIQTLKRNADGSFTSEQYRIN